MLGQGSHGVHRSTSFQDTHSTTYNATGSAFRFDTPAEDLMYLMHTMLDKGHVRRILFGIDANYTFDKGSRASWEAERDHPEAGARTYAYTYTHAIPLMERWGFTHQEIHTFLVDNPRRTFGTTRI